MKNDKVLIIASAGGHLTQAMCISSICNNIVLVSNKINILDNRLKKIYTVFDTQFNIFYHIVNFFIALYIIFKEKPKVIFSTGGPIVLPFAFISKVSNIKFIYVDTLSRVIELSNSGKFILKFKLYDEFFTQWKSLSEKYKVDYIGKCFDLYNSDTSGDFYCETKNPIVLVTVGTSQYEFNRMFDLISKMNIYSDENVRWIIQSGGNVSFKPPVNSLVFDSISRSEMESYIKSASLVISHCGIGSINLMLSYRKRVIFIPRVSRLEEFSDDHQLQIASELNNSLFSVIYNAHDIPLLSINDLISFKVFNESINITNESMAETFHKMTISQS